ncbi:MAG: exopolysaccharide biosynthesis polyprenyl glycosylphosphotransferase [Bacteroidetes bacterium]|nr:MAG: exopolysaccharide biosynthesis polyprenyl glycosylphosphotransferase [Bacteroidota bacterium]
MKNKNWKRILRLVLLEFFALNLSLLVVFFIDFRYAIDHPGDEVFLKNYLYLVILFNICWAVILYNYGNSESYLDNSFRKRLALIIPHSIMLLAFVSLVCFLFQVNFFIQATFFVHIILFNLFNVLLFKLWVRFSPQQTTTADAAKVLIVGSDKSGGQMPDFAETVRDQGYQVIGMLDNNGHRRQPSPYGVNGQVDDLSLVLEANPVDEIFIAFNSLNKTEVIHAIETADYHGVRVTLVPDKPDFLATKWQPKAYEEYPAYQLRRSPLDDFKNYVIKRIFDLAFSLAVLVMLAPVFLIIGLFIYLEDGGAIFYTPIRKGKKGASFKCYKFRTMSVCDDPVNGRQSTVENDPRITPIGRFMRKYDIDELPQFINVLLGDMSVVGPRPHRVFLQHDFRRIVNEYMVRHYVLPGITGWAQVNGWRGPTKTNEQKRERVKHDLWYIEHWSFGLDLKIIWLTLFGKKTRKNAF